MVAGLSSRPASSATSHVTVVSLCATTIQLSTNALVEVTPERFGPPPERTVGQYDAGRLPDWVDPQEGARLTEVTEGVRRRARCRPVRCLVSADLHPQPPIARPVPPIAGHEAGQPGEPHRPRGQRGIGREECRNEQVVREAG